MTVKTRKCDDLRVTSVTAFCNGQNLEVLKARRQKCSKCYHNHVGMPVDFSNDVLGTLAPPRRSQILMVRGIHAQLLTARCAETLLARLGGFTRIHFEIANVAEKAGT